MNPTIIIRERLGFAAGGLAVYGYMVSIPYCERCSQYFSRTGKQTRYTGDAEALQASAAQIVSDFDDNAIASALQKHGTFGNRRFQRGNHLRSVIDVRHCKKCGQHRVKYLVEKQRGSDWEEIPELTAAGSTTQALDI